MTPTNAVDLRFSGLSQDEQTTLDQADRFAREQMYPLSQKMDDEEWWPEQVFATMGDTGYFGIPIPENHGGAGMDLFTSGLVLQAFSRWNHALALSWVAHENLCLYNIYRNANEEQRARYLPGLISGKTVGALGLTEPGAGSDALGSMSTTATRDGDDYLLNGTKIYITNGPVADVLLVYAKTEKAKGAKGISAFIVEKNMPGFKVAQKLQKMGFRGSQTGELVFENCRVPVSHLVGEEHHGFKLIMANFNNERLFMAAQAYGFAQVCLEEALDWARQRHTFGQALSERQVVRHKLMDMQMRIDTARSTVHELAYRIEHQLGDPAQLVARIAMAKVLATQAMQFCADQALQILGGMGYMRGTRSERIYREVKVMMIGGGSEEIMKDLAARQLGI